MNELTKVELIEAELSIIEKSHKSSILSIHENMQELINNCISIEVPEDDKESYYRAVELKKIVKATHVEIDKRKKEFKKPLTDYNKRLDKWVDGIYNPLVQAEKIVKKKMEAYEKKQEKLKEERKIIAEQQKNEELLLENRLIDLNSQLQKINFAKSKAELKQVEVYLDSIVLSDFGKKSNEAGFILNQLKMTCSMASRLMKDEEEQPVQAPKLETTPITDDFVNELKEMSIEPTKKVVIENEFESGLFEKNVIEEPKTEQPKVEGSIISAGGFIRQGEPKNEQPKVEGSVISENVNELSFDEQANIIQEDSKIENKLEEKIKVTDEDVINVIDHISIDALPFVNNFIIEKTNSIISNVEAFNQLDYSEYKDLIYLEVKKRIGVLLSK